MSRSRNNRNARDFGVLNNNNINAESRAEAAVAQQSSEVETNANNTQPQPNQNLVVRTVSKQATVISTPASDTNNSSGNESQPESAVQQPQQNVDDIVDTASTEEATVDTAATTDAEASVATATESNIEQSNIPQPQQSAPKVEKPQPQATTVAADTNDTKKGGAATVSRQEIAYKAYCQLNGKQDMPKKNFSEKEIAKILKEYSLLRHGRIIPHEVLVEYLRLS